MDFIVIIYSMLYRSTSLFLINVHTLSHLISSSVTGRTQLYYLCEVSLEKKNHMGYPNITYLIVKVS